MDRSGIHALESNITDNRCPRIHLTENLVRGYYKDEETPVLWSEYILQLKLLFETTIKS